MNQPVPQLRMSNRHFDGIEFPHPPPGYDLRTYRPGDEDAWVALLSTGEFDAWDRPRLERMLAGERAPLPLDGIFFATLADRPVATACTFLHPSANGAIPELGWVVVEPQQRGHALGELVCRGVLNFVSGLGYRYIFLKTEDFRLAAIKIYLRLGFEPEMVDPAHPAWWELMLRRLAGT